MNAYEIEKYMREKRKFTIPEIQNQFHLSYGEIRRFFQQLEDCSEIVFKDGLEFEYNLEEEKTIELYHMLLWECILEDGFNKFSLRKKFNLKKDELENFENWLRKNDYYNFNSDELLISKDEFINRYGKIDNKKSNIDKAELEKLKKDVLTRLQRLSDEQKDDNIDLLEEDLESEDEFDISNCNLIFRTFLKEKKHIDRTWPKSMFINLFNCIANREGVMTKDDFLFSVELEIKSREKDSPFSKEVLVQIIEEIEDFTEDEYQELKSILSAL